MAKVAKVRASVEYGALANESFMGSTGYMVTLRYRGRRATFPFYMGAAHTKEPTASDVLECLCSDASGFENARSFEDWAAEYGYDTDSRSAMKTYRDVERNAQKLRRLLGDDFDGFMFSDEYVIRERCED